MKSIEEFLEEWLKSTQYEDDSIPVNEFTKAYTSHALDEATKSCYNGKSILKLKDQL